MAAFGEKGQEALNALNDLKRKHARRYLVRVGYWIRFYIKVQPNDRAIGFEPDGYSGCFGTQQVFVAESKMT